MKFEKLASGQIRRFKEGGDLIQRTERGESAEGQTIRLEINLGGNKTTNSTPKLAKNSGIIKSVKKKLGKGLLMKKSSSVDENLRDTV